MNYHQILGVPPGAGKERIKKAYRRIAMQSHPDRTDDPAAHERFRKATIAYDALVEGKIPKRRVRSASRTKTAKEKYWNRTTPPRDKREYQDWYNVAQEKARHYSRIRYEQMKKEAEAFRKTSGYWAAIFMSGLLSLGIIVAGILSLVVPWYMVINFDSYGLGEQEFERYLSMAVFCTALGLVLLYFSRKTYIFEEWRYWRKNKK